jgi:hypothetical protein
MDSTKANIIMEIPPDIRAILAERSFKCGMDESSYAAQVIIDYLKHVRDEAESGDGSIPGGDLSIDS